MGVWGTGPFENDTALDWLDAFIENDFRLIDRTLAGVAHLQPADELDADEAAEAIAAAECVAAALGRPAASLPEEIVEWVADNRPFTVKPLYIDHARLAVARVMAQSELRELWEERGEFEVWQTAVLNLQQRLIASS